MADRPILFSGSMVRALLDGRKTMTRRVLKPWVDIQNAIEWLPETAERVSFPDPRYWTARVPGGDASFTGRMPVPYAVGDRLWVRESGWERPERTPKMMLDGADTWDLFHFDADGIDENERTDLKAWGFKRRPSIHMPRWASRLTLTVTAVKVERLQEISEADAVAEGVDLERYVPVSDSAGLHGTGEAEPTDPVEEFRDLWSTLHPATLPVYDEDGKRIGSQPNPAAWDANPWVAAVSFTVERRNIDAGAG
jgi:hypothetical protein